MKRILLSLSAMAIGGMLAAQVMQVPLGADFSLPMGDFGKTNAFGIGPAAGFELPIGDRIGITAQAAYQFMVPKSEFKGSGVNMTMIPAQLGVKYYFQDIQDGVYAHGQAGMHTTTLHGGKKSISETNFSWGLGVGYQLEEFDFGIRYNSISPDKEAKDLGAKASDYIGIRVAYLFRLGR